MLKVANLSIRFPVSEGYIEPVKELFLYLEQNEILAVIGPSGCGKTVLCTALLGMLEYPGFVHSGEITFSPQSGTSLDLLRLSEKEWQKLRGKTISLIFQNPVQALNHSWTIGSQFIETIRSHNPKTSKQECLAMAEDMLDKVLFNKPRNILRMYPFELSGGMGQRVIIAMALVHHPALLIADEPTTALDMRSESEVLRLLQQIREIYHTAILLVSHDTRVLSRIADRTLAMAY
ncbi:MAG: ABC transporter ATP-binding protein [Spirochaetaceae bacterium]|nr:ABC transporter ATP-binding protein [Spirochaetaceae bacterium]